MAMRIIKIKTVPERGERLQHSDHFPSFYIGLGHFFRYVGKPKPCNRSIKHMKDVVKNQLTLYPNFYFPPIFCEFPGIKPAAGVAISPWADLTHSGFSAITREGSDPLCRVDFLNMLARRFLAGALPTHPDASPVYANVQGLAPILIQIGENEVMLSDAIKLAANLGEARVRTTLEVWPGMFHVWHLLAGILPEADQALRNAIRFLEEAFTGEPS